MDLVARMHLQPSFHLVVLVGYVVVHNDMDVQYFWHILINVAQELKEFLVAMADFALSKYPT